MRHTIETLCAVTSFAALVAVAILGGPIIALILYGLAAGLALFAAGRSAGRPAPRPPWCPPPRDDEPRL